MKILYPDEIKRLFRAITHSRGKKKKPCFTGIRNSAMIAVMYGSGLRVGETCDLSPGDVSLEEKRINVGHGKGDKQRITFIPPEMVYYLLEWENIADCRQKYYFFTQRGRRVLSRHIQDYLKRLASRADVDPARVHPHVFRHTFATELLDQGFTIREVQYLLGHSSVTSTQVYTAVSEKKIQEKMRMRKTAIPNGEES